MQGSSCPQFSWALIQLSQCPQPNCIKVVVAAHAGVNLNSRKPSQLQFIAGLFSDLLGDVPAHLPHEATMARTAGGHGEDHEFVCVACSIPVSIPGLEPGHGPYTLIVRVTAHQSLFSALNVLYKDVWTATSLWHLLFRCEGIPGVVFMMLDAIIVWLLPIEYDACLCRGIPFS